MITVEEALEIVHEACARAGGDRRLLPSPMVTVDLINYLDFEVNLGGVYGWLVNMGNEGPETVNALEVVGARRCAAIVRDMLAFFPNGTPASTDRERVQQLESASENDLARWRELGLRLLEWPDDIHALLQAYVTAHEDDFGQW